MVNIYFIYAEKYEISKKILERVIWYGKLGSEKNWILNCTNVNSDVNGLSGATLDKEIKNGIKNADVIVILWSDDCFAENADLRKWIKAEIEIVKKDKSKYIIPYILGNADPTAIHDEDQEKLFSKISEDKLSNSEELDNFAINIFRRIIEVNYILVKVSQKSKELLLGSNYFLNELINRRDGGFFLRIDEGHEEFTYANTLKRFADNAESHFFAILTQKWFENAFNQLGEIDDDVLEYFEKIKEIAHEKNINATRIMIGSIDLKLIDSQMKEKFEKLIKSNDGIKFYYLNYQQFGFKGYESVDILPDYAIFDEDLVCLYNESSKNDKFIRVFPIGFNNHLSRFNAKISKIIETKKKEDGLYSKEEICTEIGLSI